MDKEDRSIHNSIHWVFPWKLRSPRPLRKCLGLRNHIKGTLIAAEKDFCLKRLVTAESKREYKTTPRRSDAGTRRPDGSFDSRNLFGVFGSSIFMYCFGFSSTVMSS